ncbi:MAG: alkaline phosphatase D family protein [Pseudomonadales bacterium]|nr:alkaline phosphatase D family protein [Pseudomonadales bacterium]
MRCNTKVDSDKISKGFEQLVTENSINNKEFDVIIIGSGYGGSIAAAELSACTENGKSLSVCVLERGNEYSPGSFPSSIADIASHVRWNRKDATASEGTASGLFDFRLNENVSSLLGNGLGGGSLINAGVMEIPKKERFDQFWPKHFEGRESLDDYYTESKNLLGAAAKSSKNNDILTHKNGAPEKFTALDALSPKEDGKLSQFRAAAITVAMEDKITSGGIKLNACNYCGDCFTGCNFNAKESLDTNLLNLAQQQGATLITGATVIRLENGVKSNDSKQAIQSWEVITTYTNKNLQMRQGAPVVLRAKRVILAAGTFGSTEILKRSECDDLSFSKTLGSRFSGNGDMLAFAYNQNLSVNAVSKREIHPLERKVGPTITGVVDTGVVDSLNVDSNEPHTKDSFVIQELAVPNALRQFFAEAITTTNLFRNFNVSDNTQHYEGDLSIDPLAVDSNAINNTSVLALFGDDKSGGTLELYGDENNIFNNGNLRVNWPAAKRDPLYDKQIAYLEKMHDNAGLEGTIIPNPVWQFLPPSMSFLAEGSMRGPLMTVHPLGGCAMADHIDQGVVNDIGQVFRSKDTEGTDTHDGLVVLDGSIIPTALETNPALTIASVSLRAIRKLIDQWGFEKNANASGNLTSNKKITDNSVRERIKYRNVLDDYGIKEQDNTEEQNTDQNSKLNSDINSDLKRSAPTSTPASAESTKMQLVERLGGEATFKGTQYHIDLTLRYIPKAIDDITFNQNRSISILENGGSLKTGSYLRMVKLDTWEQITNGTTVDSEIEKKLNSVATFIAPASGELHLFGREKSSPLGRRIRTIYAWLLNRGLRDIYQSLEKDLASHNNRLFSWIGSLWKNRRNSNELNLKSRIKNTWALASRAGEVRTLLYNIKIGNSSVTDNHFIGKNIKFISSFSFQGEKRLTYSRRSNPWRQLMSLKLINFPYQKKLSLQLDTKFIAKQKIPLLQITSQTDQISALASSVTFLAFIVRVILNIHLFSFRLPDASSTETTSRLPQTLDGIDPPEIVDLNVNQLDDGTPVTIRLTRYRNSDKPPLVAIHGYSVSGSMFTHENIGTNLVQYFSKNYDVWILDLRTSGAFKTAKESWCFEDVAFEDIPYAFDHIYKETQKKINVLSHCMGSAMISMAILKKPEIGDRYFEERTQLPDYIRCLALSQVGPRVNLSPDNYLRAYLLNYGLQFFDLKNYRFQNVGEPSIVDNLVDRFLTTLPYPEEEFDLENPRWPWQKANFTRTRHRADAVYGRNFNLKNIDKKLLKHIDDIYGHLSAQTVAQVIQFSKWNSIATKEGYNDYVSRKNLIDRWRFNTFSVHGEDNDEMDVSTVALVKATLEDAGLQYSYKTFINTGHLDSMIGTAASDTFAAIDAFFKDNASLDNNIVSIKSKSKTVTEIGVINTPENRNNNKGALNTYAVTPWIGPHIGPIQQNPLTPRFKNDVLPVSLGFSPGDTLPYATVVVPTIIKHGLFQIQPVLNTYDDSDTKSLETKDTARTSFRSHNNTSTLHIKRFPTNANRDLVKLEVPNNIWRDKNVDGFLVLFVHGNFEPSRSHHSMLMPIGSDSEIDKKIETAVLELLQTRAIDLYTSFIKKPKPNSSSDALCFVAASCQFPHGLLDKMVAYKSYERLNNLPQQSSPLESNSTPTSTSTPTPTSPNEPSIMLLMGDQVYVDSTAGLFDPTARHDRYNRPYQNLYQNEHVRSVMKKLPSFNMIDDHEIINNWESLSKKDLQNEKHKTWGIAAFKNWQRKYSHTLHSCTTHDKNTCNGLWFDFEENDFSFFMVDSRTERQHRNAKNVESANMMGKDQFNALIGWLKKQSRSSKPKFIISPSLLLPRTARVSNSQYASTALHSDSWEGYPYSFKELISAISEYQVNNVVLVSGDAHLSFVSELEISCANSSLNLLSIHSSGLYSPLPFANARKQDIAFNENFDFQLQNKAALNVQVKTQDNEIVLGDGFATIDVVKGKQGWLLTTSFSRENGTHMIKKTLLDSGSTPGSIQQPIPELEDV